MNTETDKTWAVTMVWSNGTETVTVHGLTGWEALIVGQERIIETVMSGEAAVSDEQRDQFAHDRNKYRETGTGYDLYAREVTA